MNYRLAQRGDARGIALLMRELGYSIEEKAVGRKIDEFARSDVDAILIAQEEGKPLGVISCHIISCLHQESPRSNNKPDNRC